MEAGGSSHSSNKPVLSIVVALYNCENTVADCGYYYAIKKEAKLHIFS